MKQFYSLLFAVFVFQQVESQYTRFNNGFSPPFPDNGCGYAIEMIMQHDTMCTIGFVPLDLGNGRNILQINSNGDLLENLVYPEGDVIHYSNYSDEMPKIPTGYIYSGQQDAEAFIMWQNHDFSESFRITYTLYSDTTIAANFANCITVNGDVITNGRLTYDLVPETPGSNYSTLLLARHEPDGTEVWFHEYTVEDLGVDISEYPAGFIMPRGGIKELESNELILWCQIGYPYDCYAIKFDSEGHYLAHQKWDAGGTSWPVQISDHVFLMAYMRFSHMEGTNAMYKPVVGWLNAIDMSFTEYQMLEHPYYYGDLSDFEVTPDGYFVMLGNGLNGEDMGKAFMLKVDAFGNEIWHHEYFPPEDYYHTATAYDLEITPDGGLAFVGNYFSVENDLDCYKTWVVKTDACGELQDLGCDPVIGLEESRVKELKIYPNPSSAWFVLESPAAGISKVEIIDVTGQLIQSVSTDPFQKQHMIFVDRLTNGCYAIRATTNEGSIVSVASFMKQ